MRVMLLKDVYKLGRAGDVKKVADGFGRNFLLPQGLAVLATPGALKQADYIRQKAGEQRARLNQELGAVAERIQGVKLVFPAKAGETGKLYGSITTAMIGEALKQASGAEVDRRQIDCQPVKTLGVHTARIRLTIDLIPEITIVVHREGESPETAYTLEPVAAAGEEFAELASALDEEAEAARTKSAPSEDEVAADAEEA